MNIFQYTTLLDYSRHLLYKGREELNPRGKIVTIIFSAKATRYDVYDYFKRCGGFRIGWKNRRKMGVKYKKLETAVLQYHMCGYCLAFKRALLNSSMLIRNVLTLFPFELRFPIYSPAINSIGIRKNHRFLGFRKAKKYFLRNKSPRYSATPFTYVVASLYEDDFIEYSQNFWN